MYEDIIGYESNEVGIVLYNIGQIYRICDRFEEALIEYKNAECIFKKIERLDKIELGIFIIILVKSIKI
jgi:hypothetical protein